MRSCKDKLMTSDTAILKSTNCQKSLNLLFGQHKQPLDRHGFGYDGK